MPIVLIVIYDNHNVVNLLSFKRYSIMRKINLLVLVVVLYNKVYASSPNGFWGRGWPDNVIGKPNTRMAFIRLPDILPPAPNTRPSINFFIDMSVNAVGVRIPLTYLNSIFMDYLTENGLWVNSPFSESAPITGVDGNTLYRLRDTARDEIANNDNPISLYRGDSVIEILLVRNREITDTDIRTIEMLIDCLNEHEEQNLVTIMRVGGFLGNEITRIAIEETNREENEENDEYNNRLNNRLTTAEMGENNLISNNNEVTTVPVGPIDEFSEEEGEEEEWMEEEENNKDNTVKEVREEKGSIDEIPTIITTRTLAENNINSGITEVVTEKTDEEEKNKKEIEVNEEKVEENRDKVYIRKDSIDDNTNQKVGPIRTVVNEEEDKENENKGKNRENNDETYTIIPARILAENNLNSEISRVITEDISKVEDEEKTEDDNENSFKKATLVSVEDDINNNHRTSFFSNIISRVVDIFHGVTGWLWNRTEENPETDTEENNDEIPAARRIEVITEDFTINNDNHETSFLRNIFSGIGDRFYRFIGWFRNRTEENPSTMEEINLKEKRD